MHPKFQMIVLANRPGFPFLGNDFFREIGDVFAVRLALYCFVCDPIHAPLYVWSTLGASGRGVWVCGRESCVPRIPIY